MKTNEMGGTQSSTTRWALASAVYRSLPSSDNYFTQLLGQWAAENSVRSRPLEITLDDSDDEDDDGGGGGGGGGVSGCGDGDDDVQIVKVEPPRVVLDEYHCELSFTEAPGKSKSRMHLSRDRAKMSPYYRPSRVITRRTYMEMLGRHIPNYCSERVSFKRVHPKRNVAAETSVGRQLKSPITKYSIVDYVVRKQLDSPVVLDIFDDDDDDAGADTRVSGDVADDKGTPRKRASVGATTRSRGRGEWFESFRRELDALNEARERENDLQEAAYEKIVKNRSSLIRKPAPPLDVHPQTPPLTAQMRQQIQDAFKRADPHEVLIKQFKLEITRADIDTLKGLTWLNDTIINFYLNMIAARSQVPELKLPRVYTFSTFFYTRLSKEGHKGVKRWTRRDDIFVNDILLVPVHLGMHWCLAAVDFRRKSINYYDSMGGSNDHCTSCLLRYLQDELHDKKQQTFDVTGWTCTSLKDLPQQGNGSDCGMFACKYAEYIARDARINFTQKDMPYFRQRMVYEIIEGKLL